MSLVSLSPPPQPGPSTARKKRQRKPSDTPAPRRSSRRVQQSQSSASKSEETPASTVFQPRPSTARKKKPPSGTPAPPRSSRRVQQSQSSASESESSEVILLKKGAVGSNPASSYETQYKFMQVMGLIDEMEMPQYDNLPCPISDEQVAVLTTANSHIYCDDLDDPPRADGLYVPSTLNHILRQRDEQGYGRCNCIAHAQLAEQRGVEYKRHLRQLMRTTEKLQKETGLNFALSFIGIFLNMAGYENFVPQSSGMVDGVSYVLLAQDGSELHFKGYPDYVVYYEGDLIVTRILVVMGEVQLTNNPDVQNAICAVGCVQRTPLKQLLVVTVYKNKSVKLLIARLKEANLPPDVPPNGGAVSIKCYGTPHTMDLTAKTGVRVCLSLIHYYLQTVAEQLKNL